MKTFSIAEREIRPGCRGISIEGELDLAVADQLQRVLDTAAQEVGRIVVELQDCEFIDSTGIAVLIRAHVELEKRGGRLAVCGASEQVLRVFQLAGLMENGLVVESVGEVLS